MQRKFSKRALRWIDEVSLTTLIVIAAFVVLCCALGFWYWCGLAYSNDNRPVTFGNSVYFSVVTFTSLGYGDIIPVGYGKVLAAVEVVLGLAFLGTGIAKLSSAKQNYHLAQLYARDAQERIEDYVISLRQWQKSYRVGIETLKEGKTLSPGAGALHNELSVLLLRIYTYLSFEIANGDLLNEMPIGPAAKMLKACTRLSQYVVNLANFRKSQHSEKQRRHAKRVVLSMSGLSDLVLANCHDAALRSEAQTLRSECDAAVRALKKVSEEVSVAVQEKRSEWPRPFDQNSAN
jgi:hypothetical protein